MTSVHQPGPAAALQADGLQGPFCGVEDCAGREHEPCNHDPFLTLPVVGGPLLHEEGEAKVSVPYVLDIVQSACKYVLHHKGLHQRSLHADRIHSGLPRFDGMDRRQNTPARANHAFVLSTDKALDGLAAINEHAAGITRHELRPDVFGQPERTPA